MRIFSKSRQNGTKAKTLSRAFKIGLRTRSKASLCVSLLGFFMAFLPAAISVSFRMLTDSLQTLYAKGPAFLKPAMGLFAVLAALHLVQTVFTHLQNYFSGVDALQVRAYIKETIIRIGCRVKYKYIENCDDFQERIAFADSFSGLRVAGSMSGMITWLQNLLVFITLLAVLVELNVWIVLALLATSIPAAYLSYLQKDESYRINVKWMTEGALAINQYHDCCTQYSLNEVRYFGIFDFLKSKWKNSVSSYLAVKNKATKKYVLYNSIADLLRNGVFLVVLLLVTKGIFDNPRIGLGAFTLVLSAAGQFQTVTAKLFVGAAQFWEDISYMEDYFSMEDLECEELSQECSLDHAKIEFNHVAFTYPGGTEPAIHDLNLTIQEGEKIAVVGANGSGKSSFINLLCGMHEPQKGEAKIGGERITERLYAARNMISVVFQDFVKYEATIRQNITISDRKRKATDASLNVLLKITKADEFVETQPDKLDEVIGTFSETGNNLSGGQWQRLVIARAAYRTRTKIMILDEPTSALDPLSEAELYKNFSELTGDRTTILVSHRLGVASIVDRILVFDQGRIVEDGSHSELIKKNGYYAKMYQAQAKWYV